MIVTILLEGILAPWLFAQLIQSSAASVFLGDLVGAGLMLIAAAVEMAYGVKAERQSLENIATPLSAQVGISWKP